MPESKKNILFIIANGPFSSNQNAAALDMLLAAGINQLAVTAIFTDDGIFTLLQNQQAQQLQATNFSKMWQALSIYNVKKTYVLENSLIERNITSENLTLFPEAINTKKFTELMQQQDFILRF